MNSWVLGKETGKTADRQEQWQPVRCFLQMLYIKNWKHSRGGKPYASGKPYPFILAQFPFCSKEIDGSLQNIVGFYSIPAAVILSTISRKTGAAVVLPKPLSSANTTTT